MGTITIGRRWSGAACPQGGRRRHGGATLPQARARAAPPCSAPGADWGGQAPPPYRRRGPSGRSCSATGAPVLAGTRRPAPSLPSSILRPAQWLCRPCPPPAAWRGPGRRLLDTKYSVAGKLLSYGIITGIRSEMLMWTVGSCCIEWLGIMF